MNLDAAARAYVVCVELEEKARSKSPDLAEELAVRRADLHALLMDALRQSHIPFSDRADAARLAFDLVRRQSPRRAPAQGGATVQGGPYAGP